MVAGVAYHALHHGPVDTFAAALGGYAILMVVLQLRLAPIYIRLPFSAAFWSFTFPTAAVGLDGVQWLQTTRPTGFTAYTAIVLGIVTAVVGSIAYRSILALSRHQFFPVTPATTVAAEAASKDAPPAALSGTLSQAIGPSAGVRAPADAGEAPAG